MHISQKILNNIDTSTPDDVITLDYEGRFLRRKRLITDSGEAFLVELPEAISLSASDGFVLEDGRIIAIKPKPEPLLKVRHNHLLRIAWHIGNRHTPCQIEQDYLLIQQTMCLKICCAYWGQILKSWRLLSHLKVGRMGMVAHMAMSILRHTAIIIKMIIITDIDIGT